MKKKILISILALVLLFVLTFSITSCIIANRTITTTTTSIRNQSNNIQNPDDPNRVPLDYSGSFYLIDALFQNFSIFDVDYETAMLAAIRAYVVATGDQLNKMNQSNPKELCWDHLDFVYCYFDF